MKKVVCLIIIFYFLINKVYAHDFYKACKDCEIQINLEEELKKILHESPTYITLEECLNVAIDNNYGIKINKKILEAKEYSYKNSLSKFLPNVGLTGYGNLTQGEVLVGGILLDDVNEFAMTGGIYISHDLTQGGKTIFEAKQSEFTKKSESMKLKNTKEVTLRDVAKKYYSLLESKLAIEIYIRNYNERIAQLKLIENLKKAGLGTKFDVIRGENEVADAKQVLYSAINVYRLNQASLANMLGIDVMSTLYPIENNANLYEMVDDNKTVENIYQTAIKNRKDIKSLEFEIKSDRYKRKINYSDFIPKVDINYKCSYQGTISQGLRNNTQFIINANIPIGKNLGVGTYTKLKEEEAEIEAKELQLIDKKRGIKNDIINHTISSKLSKERAIIGLDRIKYATETVRLAELRLNSGNGILIDVIQTQTEKTRARVSQLGMAIEYNINQIELLYDMGLISIKELTRKYSP